MLSKQYSIGILGKPSRGGMRLISFDTEVSNSGRFEVCRCRTRSGMYSGPLGLSEVTVSQRADEL